ncbi:MAG: lipocalin-like domain-containing protein [Promethearchaeota archaeon]
MTIKIKEAWSGPGKRDEVITEFKPEYDALHIDMNKKGNAEWWYFDARLDNEYVIVGFFRAKHERTGKTGVEIVIYQPDGKKIQKVFDYDHSDLSVSDDRADVRIGNNFIKVDYSNEKLPSYEIFIDEDDIGFHLRYNAKVHGWMPGKGYTQFGKLGHFGWCVALPKADVEGTIRINNEQLSVKGIGYHDHNWLNFNMVRVVDYWYWGRLYSDTFTFIFAYIKCNKKMENYPIRVLMLAKDENIILSTGEYEITEKDFQYDEKAQNNYPKTLIFKISNQQQILLEVQEIIDSDNLLFELSPVLRFIAKYLLRLKPGYFRFNSKFNIDLLYNGKTYKEQGNTLHEMVIVKKHI